MRIEAPELPIQIRHVLSSLAVIRLIHLGGGLILLRFVRECNLYIRAWKIICAFIARDSPFSLWTMRCEALLKATFEYKPNVNGTRLTLSFDFRYKYGKFKIKFFKYNTLKNKLNLWYFSPEKCKYLPSIIFILVTHVFSKRDFL